MRRRIFLRLGRLSPNMDPSELVNELVAALATLHDLGAPRPPRPGDERRRLAAVLQEARRTVDRLSRYGLSGEDFSDAPNRAFGEHVDAMRRLVQNALEIASIGLFSGAEDHTCERDLKRALRTLDGLIEGEQRLLLFGETPEVMTA